MQFAKYGKLNPNLTNEINPLEFSERAVFRRLDYLLGYLQERELKTEFVDRLRVKLQDVVDDSGLEIGEADLKFSADYPNLADQPKLVELQLLSFGQFLQISAFPGREDNPIEVPDRDYLRSYLVPRYYQALVLTEMLGKEKATELGKTFIDDYTISMRHLVTQVDDLEAVRAHNLGEDPENAEGWIIVVSNVEDGKWIMRNDNCPMVEALDDYADKDLVYLACCHGDFIYADMMNENLKFTRAYTIAEGHPYCDKVFHDTRYSDMKHPGPEFWESLDERLEAKN
jgi:hypothetical protein